MSRYHGPRLRVIRRLGELPALTRKKPKNQNPPGQHKEDFLKKNLPNTAFVFEKNKNFVLIMASQNLS